jgi:MFS family permease
MTIIRREAIGSACIGNRSLDFGNSPAVQAPSFHLAVLAGLSCGARLGADELGFVLNAATAVRLFCGPIAGRVADRFQLFRAELAVCASVAAGATLLYLLADGFWAVMAISRFKLPTPYHSPMHERKQSTHQSDCDFQH